MVIVTNPDGWLISPETKDEYEHLEFLMKALRSTYSVVVPIPVAELTSQPEPESLGRNKMAASG